MKRKKTKVGKLILNGVKPESHELDILLFFTNLGKDIELIQPSLTPNSKNADILMDGLVWEMKSPEGKSKTTIEHTLKKAARQSSNIIIDLQRIQISDECALVDIKRYFKTSCKIKRIYVITKDKRLLDINKKSC